MTDNKEAQSEELLVLQSIYDERYFAVECMDPPCGRFSAHVQLSDLYNVKLKHNISLTEPDGKVSGAEYEEFGVSYLPPINLYFEYPETYPSDSPPAFFLSCCWLSYEQLSKLCKKLDILWTEGNGEVILFQWVQFLKEETLTFLNLEDCLDITELSKYNLKNDLLNSVPIDVKFDKCAISEKNVCENIGKTSRSESEENAVNTNWMLFVKPSVSGGNGPRDRRAFLEIADGKVLKNMIKDYNESKKAEHFSESWHLCSICFVDKLGSEFVTFKTCQHFFCKNCIKSYFELMISEGNVNSLSCPQDKCDTQADGTVVKQIVSEENFIRYDSLLLSRTLETMTDIAYCPRTPCQCPLLIDVSGRIGHCPACNFVFCPFCKMAYHGVAPCKFNPALKHQISDDYLQGDELKKSEIESRYGKRVIKTLVEEVLSEKWIGTNSKPCPHCNASIEKTEGCNKMTCYKCGTYFCWLCSKQLNTGNPYSHYAERDSECYQRLFPEDVMNDEFMFEPGAFLNFL